MLELRPSCEHCNKALPADSLEARICSFECTFCVGCIETVLGHDACPNCGGGFMPRPIRPALNWRNGNCLAEHPATQIVKHRPIDLQAYAQLIEALKDRAPEQR